MPHCQLILTPVCRFIPSPHFQYVTGVCPLSHIYSSIRLSLIYKDILSHAQEDSVTGVCPLSQTHRFPCHLVRVGRLFHAEDEAAAEAGETLELADTGTLLTE